MDIPNILKQLREELAKLNESIRVIERMAAGMRRGPGRPPKWMIEAKAEPKRRGGTLGSGAKEA